MPPYRFPGPQCRFRLLDEIDDGTNCRSASHSPGPLSRVFLWPEMHVEGFLPAAAGLMTAITKSDIDEFKIVKRMPVLNSKRHPYRNVYHYVSDRTLYFGAPSVYACFAADSDKELAETKWGKKKRVRTLRSMIEFGKNTKQQQIFYRWVRKAYKRKYGDDASVPEIIRKGMSPELEEQIKEVRGSISVKKIHDENFHAGGFNPRPIKYAGHYLLGTLSDHATGMAVDIDDKRNVQLTADEWAFIEDLVGKHIVRSGRWGTEEEAEDLWQDIQTINDLFVKKVADEIRRVEKERVDKEKAEKEKAEKDKAAGKPVPPQPTHSPAALKPPLQVILGKHYNRLHPWAITGFFHLPLELVLELHGHGFTWGATFKTNADLHHFQIDE